MYEDELAELKVAIDWAHSLLYYACASNRHIMIKQYPRHLELLLKASRQYHAEETKRAGVQKPQ